jgi:hypothetical protein
VLEAPPAGLCLGNYLPAEFFAKMMDGLSLHTLRTYLWANQESFERAAAWLQVGQNNESQGQFFGPALLDLYHHDRAIRAAHDNEKPPPFKINYIPRELPNGEIFTFYMRSPGLIALRWNDRAPATAVDEIARFMRNSTDYDDLRQVEYSEALAGQKVIVYATFGHWVVQLCTY